MLTGYFDRRRARALREFARLPLGDVAARLGTSQRVIRDWEQGIFEPAPSDVDRLAKIYHCHPDDLMKWRLAEDVKKP